MCQVIRGVVDKTVKYVLKSHASLRQLNVATLRGCRSVLPFH